MALTGRWLGRQKTTPRNDEAPPKSVSYVEELTGLFEAGEQARKAGDLPAAVACYEQALALDIRMPANAEQAASIPRIRSVVGVQLGHIRRDQGNTPAAESAFLAAVEADETFDQGHYFLGLLRQRDGRHQTAAAAYFDGLKVTSSPLLRGALEELDYSASEIDLALAAGALPDNRIIPDDADFSPLPIDDLAEKVKSYPWFHSINLGEGIVTPGSKVRSVISREAEAIFAPISVKGRSVMDIGAWNGGFTVEAKRRGAGRILAVDEFAWVNPEFRGRETFDLVMSRLGIEVETKLIDVAEINVEDVGSWQVVLFLGVLYHLLNPIDALKRLAAITEEVLVVETHLEMRDMAAPAMAFFPGSELNGDSTNWWAPNRAAVEAMLRVFGFRKVLFTPNPGTHGIRGIFHAFKSEAAYEDHQNQVAWAAG